MDEDLWEKKAQIILKNCEGWQKVSTCNNEHKWMMNGWNEWDLTKKEDEGE